WEPRLFTTNISSIDRPSRKRAAAGAQDRPECLAISGRDDVAENTAGQCADHGAARTVPALAEVASVAVAVDTVFLAELATLASDMPTIVATAVTAVQISIPIAKARSPITTAPAIVVGHTGTQRLDSGQSRNY
ncbi:hypothetical protein SAMN05518866_1852, partial [Sphingobium sp. YR768]